MDRERRSACRCRMGGSDESSGLMEERMWRLLGDVLPSFMAALPLQRRVDGMMQEMEVLQDHPFSKQQKSTFSRHHMEEHTRWPVPG